MTTENGHFTPSHSTDLKLIKRPDGDFDTPIEISYQDPNGKVWTAPAGTITDGASIPSLFAHFFGGKLNEKHLYAAIVHDAYCAIANEGGPVYQVERWEDTHRMFHKACLANGTERIKANTMYAGVRLGGPRWPFQGETFTDLSSVQENVLSEEMEHCKEWIESQGESLELDAIDQWMEDREKDLLKE